MDQLMERFGQFVMPVIVVGVVLVFFISLIVFIRRYRKVGPNEAMVISGRKHRIVAADGQIEQVGFRIRKGGGAFIIPFIERVDILSLEVITLDIRPALSSPLACRCASTAAQIKVRGERSIRRGRAGPRSRLKNRMIARRRSRATAPARHDDRREITRTETSSPERAERRDRHMATMSPDHLVHARDTRQAAHRAGVSATRSSRRPRPTATPPSERRQAEEKAVRRGQRSPRRADYRSTRPTSTPPATARAPRHNFHSSARTRR